MMIQMITESQSRAVNDVKIHSSNFFTNVMGQWPVFFDRMIMMWLELSKYQKRIDFSQRRSPLRWGDAWRGLTLLGPIFRRFVQSRSRFRNFLSAQGPISGFLSLQDLNPLISCSRANRMILRVRSSASKMRCFVHSR